MRCRRSPGDKTSDRADAQGANVRCEGQCEGRCGMLAVMIDEFGRILWNERATAILRATSADAARQSMEAAVEGGFRILEFTLTTPRALGLIEEFARRPGLVVGAGTVLTT